MSTTPQTSPEQPATTGCVRRLVRLRENWKFVSKLGGATFKCTLMAGEVGEYFAHSDTYIFKARLGWAPYIAAKKLMANPQTWECLPND